MLFLRTPLRVSFFGGGSDLPSYFSQGKTGRVISTTIDRYIHLVVNKVPQKHYRAVYSTDETVANLEEMKHGIIRNILQLLKVPSGIEIGSFADIYVKGTGLGSSSSFAVGLLRALLPKFTPTEIAMLAAHVEIDLLQQKIGFQDQFACAHGGFNYIEFQGDHSKQHVDVLPIHNVLSSKHIRQLESQLMLIYLGGVRSAGEILAAQSAAMSDPQKVKIIDQMVKLTEDVFAIFAKDSITGFGDLLDVTWKLKKTITPLISTTTIDLIYDKLIDAGMIGGKLLGAGGSGYLLACVPPDDHQLRDRIKMVAYEEFRLESFDFNFSSHGPQVLHSST